MVTGIERESWVYFMTTRDKALIKIGVSVNPRQRLAQVQNGSELPIFIWRVTPGSYPLERELHKRFIRFRVPNTEWFLANEELTEYILASTDDPSVLPELMPPPLPQPDARPAPEPATVSSDEGRAALSDVYTLLRDIGRRAIEPEVVVEAVTAGGLRIRKIYGDDPELAAQALVELLARQPTHTASPSPR